MRLALFGGTFDPIHCAHLRVARAAADAFALDRVLFAPTGRQPLKSAPAAASYDDRLAMVALALSHPCAESAAQPAPDPRFAVSALDAPRPGGQPNYTVDLLEDLARTHPEAALFAIAGADSFLTLAQWRSPQRVLALAEWIVVSRPGLELQSAAGSALIPTTHFPATHFLARAEFAPLALTPQHRTRIHLLPGIHQDISATTLRQLLEAPSPGNDPAPTPWLSPAVAAYIREHHLYR